MKRGKTIQRGKSRFSRLNLFAVIFFVLVAVFFFAQERKNLLKAQRGDDRIRVSIVHDGDTVSILRDGREERVRLIGIDAPEIGQKPWGDAAKRELESIVESSSRRVRIEYDVERADQYGRTLAYLWTSEGRLVNLMMIERGLAVLYTVPPNVRYADLFGKAQAEARENRRGVWSEDGISERPRDYRKENPRP